MSALTVYVEGVGLWTPQLAGIAALRGRLAGRPAAAPPSRPPAARLSPNERRRAPESVLLAIEAADQAVAMSGREAAQLACVFASAYGDQAVVDYMCQVLAGTPAELSPTRFHNSVHNAPAGYWTIATGCHAPSSALSAQHASFGAGLLEAAAQALADQRPVLLVGTDTAGSGPLHHILGSLESFACALVLAPQAESRSLARLELNPVAWPAPQESAPKPGIGNPSALALPLLSALARGEGRCTLAAAEYLALQVDTEWLADREL